MNRAAFTVVFAALCLAFTAHAQAFPALSLSPDTPDINSSFITVSYAGNNTSGTLTATGFAGALTPPGSPAGDITSGTIDINATINFNAQTATGTLAIGGTISVFGFNSGSLLTGTLSSTAGDQTFGAGSSDPLEFLFTVTGGDAASLYGPSAGVILSSTGFSGTFSSSFGSSPFGSLADTFSVPPPPPTVITASGLIESTVGGFRFPDGSVQTTAGGGAAAYRFEGFTSTQVTGLDIGVLYKVCQDFTSNPKARMASTREFIESPNAVLPANPAWIRAVIVGVSRDDIDGTIQMEFSGAALEGSVGCVAVDGVGITIGNDGTISRASCYTQHVVACSVPASGQK